VVEPQTNIVFVELPPDLPGSDVLEAALERRGIRTLAFGPTRLRAIVHLDVDDAGIARAIEVFQEVVHAASGAPAARR
jgi:threonine aldolase